jgi:hypothetical protein
VSSHTMRAELLRYPRYAQLPAWAMALQDDSSECSSAAGVCTHCAWRLLSTLKVVAEGKLEGHKWD